MKLQTLPFHFCRSLPGALALLLFLGIGTGHAQLVERLQALATARLSVGDPSLVLTNLNGFDLDGPKDIAVADFDSDSRADFVVSNKDGSLSVYFGRGDGNFESIQHLRTRIGPPLDLSGLTLTNRITNACAAVITNASVICQETNPVITEVVLRLSDGPTGLRGLAVADFNGDTKQDIAVASPGESLVYVLINQGQRAFAPAQEISSWLGVRDLAAGDFDGDGRMDLLTAGTTNGIVQLRSTGPAEFTEQVRLPELGTKKLDPDFPQPAFYLRAFRRANSQKDAVVVGRAQGAPIVILDADDSGTLIRRVTMTNASAHAFDVGPLLHPKDSGILDLVSVEHSEGLLELRAGTDDGSYFTTDPALTIQVPGRAHGVAIADIDNDGWNDLVIVLQAFSKVRVLRNNHGQFETLSELPVGAGPRELAVGDFNGDGRADAAVLNRRSQDASILLAHPSDFGFASLDMLYAADGEVVSMQVYDFNGDHLDDVVQLHRASGEFSVRLARAGGTLSPPAFYSLGTKPSDARMVDINGDVFVDVLAVDLKGFVTARLGDGRGNFGPEIRTALSGGAYGASLFSLTTGDFNGDGIMDLAAGFMDCRVGFFRGKGDGTFEHTGTHLLGYETHGLLTGDFDQDGDIDLVATPWDGSLIVVRNPGDLLTVPTLDKTTIASGQNNQGAWTILMVDYNKDGDPDLLVDGGSGYTLYLGGPGLVFTPASALIPRSDLGVSLTNVISPVAADFNGDGFEDLVAGCQGQSCVTIAFGVAGGGYAPAIQVPVPSSSLLATGDIDGDGKPDLIGTGEVLWTALSSRGPKPAVPPPPILERENLRQVVINEILTANNSIAVPSDEGRTSDFVELFNPSQSPKVLRDWSLSLVETNSVGLTITNTYHFPTNAILDAGQRLVLVCATKQRTLLHTGFNLPAEGGQLRLKDAAGVLLDEIAYPQLPQDQSYARYQDGVNGFVISPTPSPGEPNPDNGLLPPKVQLLPLNEAALAPNTPIRLYAQATDDIGIINLSALWRRLDQPDTETKRVILFDDGLHEDGASQDGLFSGVLDVAFPRDAEIQFYLECTDLSGEQDTSPDGPKFVNTGQKPQMHTLSVTQPTAALEFSEILAWNQNGIRDEKGNTPDWFEIRNTTDQPIVLDGVSIADAYIGAESAFEFRGGMRLEPAGHLLIFADGKPELGPLHAPFKLRREGGQLVLRGTSPTGARTLLDVVRYGGQHPDVAIARMGRSGPWVSGDPTPNAANVTEDWRLSVVEDQLILAFKTERGKLYTVEYTDELAPAHWLSLFPIAGTGIEHTLSRPLLRSRFYRLRHE